MNISNMIALVRYEATIGCRRRRLASGSLIRVRGALIVEQTVTMNSSNMITEEKKKKKVTTKGTHSLIEATEAKKPKLENQKPQT